MNWREVARRAEGLQTVDSFAKALGLTRRTAVFYLHKLREGGFVETTRGKRGKRLYAISPLRLRPVGGKGFIDVINAVSPLQVRQPMVRRTGGREPTPEEAFIQALESRDFTLILASLALFRHMTRWALLGRLARERGLERQAGALYEVARRSLRVRRMDGRTARALAQAKGKLAYVIPPLRSRDFSDIERAWRVRIPFNKSDLERLNA